jgi:hypothetical protein
VKGDARDAESRVTCPSCGEIYLTAETLREIERIRTHWRALTVEKKVRVAKFGRAASSAARADCLRERRRRAAESCTPPARDATRVPRGDGRVATGLAGTDGRGLRT